MEKLSHQIEDYLKTIYLLQDRAGGANTNAIAESLSVKPASVTGMIKKLAEMKLVSHAPYQGVTLTRAGEKIALEVIRHHRLIELFLIETLGYSWDEVHAEADRLEHVISEDFEARVAARLGNPEVDPHGDPIPGKDGHIATVKQKSLAELEHGQAGCITRVSDEHPEMLRYAAGLGLRPQVRVTLIDSEPFGGSLRVRVGKTERAIGRELARQVYVTLES
ncbi:MAG TPA: metal-dependent transcriptional regulator [Anaerolineae bacterium]|nr:metal-dependent transcriptional regulator [Anaerolineae bacterium]